MIDSSLKRTRSGSTSGIAGGCRSIYPPLRVVSTCLTRHTRSFRPMMLGKIGPRWRISFPSFQRQSGTQSTPTSSRISALCSSCCAHQLAALPATAFAGGSTTAEGHVKVEKKAGREAAQAADASPLSTTNRPGRFGYKAGINGTNAPYVILQGENLFQTLMWNYALPPARPPQADPESKRAAWAGDGTVGKAVAISRIGYARSLTLLPRRVHLFPDQGGICSLCGERPDVLVREIFYKPGEHRPEGTDWQDPMLAYEARPEGLRPVVARGNRPLWTDLARLALPLSGILPAAILTQSYRLVRETGKRASAPGFVPHDGQGQAA